MEAILDTTEGMIRARQNQRAQELMEERHRIVREWKEKLQGQIYKPRQR